MVWYWRGIVWYGIGEAWHGIGIEVALYGIGQVHRRRSAQRMRSETSNTAIDLCPGAAFYNDTLHPRVTSFTLSFTSTQLAVNARLEVNVPRLELEFGRPRGLFPMQILIAWDFHKSEAWYVPACAGTHASLCCGGLKVQSGVLVWCQNVLYGRIQCAALVPPRGAQNMKGGYKTRMNEFHLEMKSGSRAQF